MRKNERESQTDPFCFFPGRKLSTSERPQLKRTDYRREYQYMKHFLLILSLGLFGYMPVRAEKPSWEYATSEIPGWHAQAVALAVREFQKNQGGRSAKGEPVYGNLRDYSVQLISREDEVEVAFVPKLGPKDKKDVTLGGRTQFGIEVSYHISSRSLRIVRTTFAR